MARPKVYDAEYFERWYRRSGVGVGAEDFVERKVRLALHAAEYLLGREVASVLDVGCGEGPWRAHLRRLRPGLRYEGMDGSEYAVRRFGRTRGIRLGTLATLDRLGFRGPYDLVVCADVLHYVATPEARHGLKVMHRLCGGLAFLEAFTSDDAIEGDRVAFQRRSPAAYARLFRAAGFTPVGLHLYAPRAIARGLVALERGGAR